MKKVGKSLDWLLWTSQLSFVFLKLRGTINWSWWWVMSPMWICAIFAILMIIAILIIDRKNKRYQ